MEYYTGELMATLLETSLATANIVPDAAAPKGVTFANASSEGGSKLGHSVHWGCITDQAASVKEDVERICKYELVAAGIPVHGFVYNVKTGKLEHIVSAVTKA
jgi:carbonic anhydrase